MQNRTALDRYWTSLRPISALSAAEERALALAWRSGDANAGRELVEGSLPFVVSIARQYRRWGVPFEDLIQQGNLGLLRAAEKFDPDRECRLTTYAAYWIRAEITDYVVRAYRIVRLGATHTERRAIRAYRRRGVSSPEELATLSGMPLARAHALWPLLAARDVPLDRPTLDRTPIVEHVAGSGPSPEDEAARLEQARGVRARLHEALERLSERERRIIDARLLREEPMTLAGLALEMGVSKERVRQLEERACGKLREELTDLRAA